MSKIEEFKEIGKIDLDWYITTNKLDKEKSKDIDCINIVHSFDSNDYKISFDLFPL